MPRNGFGQPIGAAINTRHFPRPRPPLTAMAGRFCSVMPFDAAHIPGLYAAFCADKTGANWTYLPYGPFDTQSDFAAWANASCHGTDPMFHTVMTPGGTPLGLAAFMRIDPAMGCIEVGNIHFSPAVQRTPASTQAMFLMMSRALGELGYRRYEWKCDALNAPSRAAASRLGFTYEGTFRQAIHYKGRNRDTAWFSITDTDWPRLRDAYRTWLDPTNFDDAGNQRTSLGAKA